MSVSGQTGNAPERTLDDTDRRIIGQLRLDGRATNQQIAQELALTPATVAARIRRLSENEQARVVAVSDFTAHGFGCMLRITVGVEKRAPRDVALELAKLPQALAVHVVSGAADIDMLLGVRGLEDLPQWLFGRISQVLGVRYMTCAVIVDFPKWQFDIAPVLAEPLLSEAPIPPSKNGNRPRFDALDLQLIQLLARDARVSNSKIATDLNVTEGTIRSRIKRMQAEKVIAFTTVTSSDVAGKSEMAIISIEADLARIQETAKKLSGLSPVRATMITTGRHNISIVCLADSIRVILHNILPVVTRMPGVRNVETSIVVEPIKYNSMIAKIGDSTG